MVSLQKYTKDQLLTETKQRFNKIASLLDDTDYIDFIEQSVRWLDTAMYNPRTLLIKPDDFITVNGGYFVDVTAWNIDEVCNVYYGNHDQVNFMFQELGILPFISQSIGFTMLDNVCSYMELQTVLNLMNRQMELSYDWELFPVDEKGRQLLQVRNVGLVRLEYLPHINATDKEWYLFDNEYRTLKRLVFAECNRQNAIIQMSASSLGVGKEASTLVDFWDKETDKIKKEFTDSQIITYLQ